MEAIKKENIYLDLSKLSGEEIKEIPNILKKGNQELYFLAKKTIESGKLDNYYKYLVFAKASINIWVFSHDKPKRIEIDLSEFRQLFSDKGEEVLQVENNGWIKIESEADLPIKGFKCLVWYNAPLTKSHIRTATYLGNNYFSTSGIKGYQFTVTHWQPKPEPPKF